jgi:hypothetical protein
MPSSAPIPSRSCRARWRASLRARSGCASSRSAIRASSSLSMPTGASPPTADEVVAGFKTCSRGRRRNNPRFIQHGAEDPRPPAKGSVNVPNALAGSARKSKYAAYSKRCCSVLSQITTARLKRRATSSNAGLAIAIQISTKARSTSPSTTRSVSRKSPSRSRLDQKAAVAQELKRTGRRRRDLRLISSFCGLLC